MKLVHFNQEKNNIEDFIKLSKKLYSKKTNMEDPKTVRSFLTNNHPLCQYFKLVNSNYEKYTAVVYNKNEVVGRFVITEYPDDQKTCYLGFFECINNKKVAKFIFDEAAKFSKEKKYKKIIGPVDASFWYKYRLKINLFENIPYTGEPYNLEYYYKMFLDNQYKELL